MRPFTRRTTGTLAAVLALGIPVLAAGAVPGTGTGTGPPAPSAAATGTSCDPDGVEASFVLDPARAAAVSRIAVTDISSACLGHEVTVVVAGVPGRALVSGARTEVQLARAVDAEDVTTLTVAITAP